MKFTIFGVEHNIRPGYTVRFRKNASGRTQLGLYHTEGERCNQLVYDARLCNFRTDCVNSCNGITPEGGLTLCGGVLKGAPN